MTPQNTEILNAKLPREGGGMLDILRFLAALFILIFHFGDAAPTKLVTLTPIFAKGWIATDFFLMLSGFILMRLYGKSLNDGREQPLPFMKKRFLRLWPAHIVMLFALGAVFLGSQIVGANIAHPDRFTATKFVAAIFMVHGVVGFDHPGWNIPTWSLSALLVAYGLFSLSARFLWPLRGLKALLAMVGWFAAISALSIIFLHQPLETLSFKWGLVRVIGLFFVGGLFERALVGTEGLRVSRSVALIALLVALGLIAAISLMPAQAFTGVCVLSLWLCILGLSVRTDWPDTPISRALGQVSFSLFITHTLVGMVYFELLDRFGLGNGQTAFDWGLWVLSLPVSVVAAFVFERFFDAPLSRWVKQNWLTRRQDRYQDFERNESMHQPK